MRPKTSGNTCARPISPTACSKTTPQSSTLVSSHGVAFSTNSAASHPLPAAIGPPWVNQFEVWYNLESNRESNSSALTHAYESRGASAEFCGTVRNTVGSVPISTPSSAEEESAQDTCDVDRRENSKRSKR